MSINKNMIESNIACPICGHYSIAPVESADDIKKKNQNVKEQYEIRMAEFVAKGGTKPRYSTYSQTLGCFCWKSNCAGSASGLGCFECEDKKGQVGLVPDERLV